jgi:hypothetical protein
MDQADAAWGRCDSMQLRPALSTFAAAIVMALTVPARGGPRPRAIVQPQTLSELRAEQLERSRGAGCPEHLRSTLASILAREGLDAQLARPNYFTRLQELLGLENGKGGMIGPRQWLHRLNSYGYPKDRPSVIVGSSDFFGVQGLYSFNSATTVDRQLATALTAINPDFTASLKAEQAGWGIQIAQPGEPPRVYFILDHSRMGPEFERVALPAYRNLFSDYLDTLFADHGIYFRRLNWPAELRARIRGISEALRGRTFQFVRVREPFVEMGPGKTRVYNATGQEEVWPDELWYRLRKEAPAEFNRERPPGIPPFPEDQLEFVRQTEHFTIDGGGMMVVSRSVREPLPTELTHPGHRPVPRPADGVVVELGRFSVAKGSPAETSPALLEQMASTAFGIPGVHKVIIEADAVHRRLYAPLGFAQFDELVLNGQAIYRLETTPERFQRALLERYFPAEAVELERSAPVGGLPRRADRLQRAPVLPGEKLTWEPTPAERRRILRAHRVALTEQEYLPAFRHVLPEGAPAADAALEGWARGARGRAYPALERARAYFRGRADFLRFLRISRDRVFPTAAELSEFLEANGYHQGARIILEEFSDPKAVTPLRERVLARGEFRRRGPRQAPVRVFRESGAARILPNYRGTALTGAELRRLLRSDWVRYAETLDPRLRTLPGAARFTGGQAFTLDEGAALRHAVRKYNEARLPLGDEPLFPVVVETEVYQSSLKNWRGMAGPARGEFKYPLVWGVEPGAVRSYALLLPGGRVVRLREGVAFGQGATLEKALESCRAQGMNDLEFKQIFGINLDNYK